MKKIWDFFSMYVAMILAILLHLILASPFLMILYLVMHVVNMESLFIPAAVIIYIVTLVKYSPLFMKDRDHR